MRWCATTLNLFSSSVWVCDKCRTHRASSYGRKGFLFSIFSPLQHIINTILMSTMAACDCLELLQRNCEVFEIGSNRC